MKDGIVQTLEERRGKFKVTLFIEPQEKAVAFVQSWQTHPEGMKDHFASGFAIHDVTHGITPNLVEVILTPVTPIIPNELLNLSSP